MILDYGINSAQTTPILLGLPLLSLLAVLYHFWTNTLDGKTQIHYPLLGHKESQDLREIVQKQWRQVSHLYADVARDAQLIPGFTGQGTQIYASVALQADVCASESLCQRLCLEAGKRDMCVMINSHYLVSDSLTPDRQLPI